MSENDTIISSEPVYRETSNGNRKILLLCLAGVIAASAIIFGIYWILYVSRFETTDNAYAAVEMAQVTPSVSGIVREVFVVDTQKVQKGDVLVVLDEKDARLQLDQTEAEYGLAVRKIRGLFANDSSLGEQVSARKADVNRTAAQLRSAEADFERASIDLERRKALVDSGSVSQDELTRVQNIYITAKANIDAARAAAAQANYNHEAAISTRMANAALIDNSSIELNPEVALTKARRDQACIDLERMIIRAPLSGVVARRQVQLGQRVQAGTPLLSIVPLSDMHVDANFKEVQLKKVKAGQKAEIFADLYGKSIKYHGTVAGFSGGTGSAFAIIPAQNATGNWIKVVQRLPVRINLEKSALDAHPLQVGLSMHVKIDTSE